MKVIFVDIGNVLFETSYQLIYKHWAQALESEVQFVSRYFVKDEMYYQFTLGEISEMDYFNHVKKLLQTCLSIDTIISGWNRYFVKPNMEIISFIINYQDKYVFNIISNTNITHIKYLNKTYPKLMGLFEKTYYSYELGVRKPDLTIYEKALFGINNCRNNTCLIDDKKENLKAIRRFGTIPIHYQKRKFN